MIKNRCQLNDIFHIPKEKNKKEGLCYSRIQSQREHVTQLTTTYKFIGIFQINESGRIYCPDTSFKIY